MQLPYHAVECPPEAPPGSVVMRRLRPTVAGYYGNYGMSSAGGSPSWYSSSRAASTAQGAAWAGATWGNSGGEDNCYIHPYNSPLLIAIIPILAALYGKF